MVSGFASDMQIFQESKKFVAFSIQWKGDKWYTKLYEYNSIFITSLFHSEGYRSLYIFRQASRKSFQLLEILSESWVKPTS